MKKSVVVTEFYPKKSTASKLAAVLAGWMILTWFFVLHLPRAIENNNQNEWTAVFEALAVSGILFMLTDISLKNKD